MWNWNLHLPNEPSRFPSHPEFKIGKIPIDIKSSEKIYSAKCPPLIQKEFWNEYFLRKLGKNISFDNIKTYSNSRIEFIIGTYSIQITLLPINIHYEIILLFDDKDNSIIGIKKSHTVCVKNPRLEKTLLSFLYFIVNKTKCLSFFFLPDSTLNKLTKNKLFDRNLLSIIMEF
jgi:hypothetical protein